VGRVSDLENGQLTKMAILGKNRSKLGAEAVTLVQKKIPKNYELCKVLWSAQ
jgi:hypothetical protein